MLKTLAAASLLISGAAAAQVVSYATDNPTPKHGKPGKIVCEQQEKLGSRLGAHRVCLTVAEWQARTSADRDQTERVQADTRAMRSN